MNRNLLNKDLQRNLKIFLGWSFVAVLFIGITMGVYSTMRESMTMIYALFATLPESIMEALQFGEEQLEYHSCYQADCLYPLSSRV